ncbi:hypothetical protein LX36DRAFT_664551 [Colletotrichum falcatum]|nr:hypothetical protein LX36DRAFT_664551 [Colletotrichum falcatum]
MELVNPFWSVLSIEACRQRTPCVQIAGRAGRVGPLRAVPSRRGAVCSSERDCRSGFYLARPGDVGNQQEKQANRLSKLGRQTKRLGAFQSKDRELGGRTRA